MKTLLTSSEGLEQEFGKKKSENVVKKIIEFIKKHTERVVLTGVVFSFMLFIGGGLLLQQKKHPVGEEQVEKAPKKIELEVKRELSETGSANTEKVAAPETGAFFLEPSADALVQKLQEMQSLRPDVAQKKLQKMRVIWRVYFFEIKEGRDGKTAFFDVAENGFGVVVSAAYSPEKFPELEGIRQGRQLWLGGEIVEVDLSGTGSVQLKMEHVDFSNTLPSLSPSTQAETSKNDGGKTAGRK